MGPGLRSHDGARVITFTLGHKFFQLKLRQLTLKNKHKCFEFDKKESVSDENRFT